MKLSCLNKSLNHALSIVNRVSTTKGRLPIIGNVLLKAENNHLKLITTNLEIFLTTWVEANVEDEGETTVSSKVISEFVSLLPSGDTISLSLQDTQLEAKTHDSEAKFPIIDASDFPSTPEVTNGIAVKLDSSVLYKAIDQVFFCAAQNPDRITLSGILAEFSNELLTLAAADGFRLSIRYLDLPVVIDPGFSIIIPTKATLELQRLLYEEVEIVVNPQEKRVLFKLPNIEMTSMLIEGTFPDFRKLIPEGYTTETVMKGSDIDSAIKTAYIFAFDNDSKAVKLNISQDEILVTSKSGLGENVGKIKTTTTGNDIKIAFNGDYIGDFTSREIKNDIILRTNSSTSSAVFKVLGEDNYTYILMPLTLPAW